METISWLERLYLYGRPSEFTNMGGCPALIAAGHLCSSSDAWDAVSSTAFTMEALLPQRRVQAFCKIYEHAQGTGFIVLVI